MSGLVLVIEDEVDLATTLEYNLRSEGFQVLVAHDGRRGLAAASAEPTPDVIILDLMLPDLTGTQVCRRLRDQDHTRNIPVIMCTAKGEEIDRVVGFEVGADDYVVKPYSVRELMLRIRAQLRRAAPANNQELARLRFGVLELDAAAHRVWVENAEISLTALEFRLLHVFVTRRGRVQSRESLLSDVWGIDVDITTRTVDTHVKRLREKLGVADNYIETLRGVGYRFKSEPDEPADVTVPSPE
jgi:two-component system phosphate regulon response regulator PhoB